MTLLLMACGTTATPQAVAPSPAPAVEAPPGNEPVPAEAASTAVADPPPAGFEDCARELPDVESTRRLDKLWDHEGKPVAGENGLGFFAVTGSAPEPRAARDGRLELSLTAPASRIVGQPLELQLKVSNRGEDTVTVVRPLDGSSEHWTDPLYDVFVRDEQTGGVYRWALFGGRCGMLNRIAPEDYVTLAPGEERTDLIASWADQFRLARIGTPGRYAVWAAYQHCGLRRNGEGEFRSIHRGTHVSNAVVVDVRAAQSEPSGSTNP